MNAEIRGYYCSNVRNDVPSIVSWFPRNKDVSVVHSERMEKRESEVCKSLTEGSKNLAATETKTVAGESKEQQDAKAKIIEFGFWMKKQGYKQTTIQTRMRHLETLVRRGANLTSSESVKESFGYTGNLERQYESQRS